jgi:hypothetical protein
MEDFAGEAETEDCAVDRRFVRGARCGHRTHGDDGTTESTST